MSEQQLSKLFTPRKPACDPPTGVSKRLPRGGINQLLHGSTANVSGNKLDEGLNVSSVHLIAILNQRTRGW